MSVTTKQPETEKQSLESLIELLNSFFLRNHNTGDFEYGNNIGKENYC